MNSGAKLAGVVLVPDLGLGQLSAGSAFFAGLKSLGDRGLPHGENGPDLPSHPASPSTFVPLPQFRFEESLAIIPSLQFRSRRVRRSIYHGCSRQGFYDLLMYTTNCERGEWDSLLNGRKVGFAFAWGWFLVGHLTARVVLSIFAKC